MSSDETETDTSGKTLKPKRVRRIAKPWIADGISEMWAAVEKLGYPEESSRGNPGVIRAHEAFRSNNRSKPVRKLPGNFYNPIWYVGRHASVKNAIQRKPDEPIPSKVCSSIPTTPFSD